MRAMRSVLFSLAIVVAFGAVPAAAEDTLYVEVRTDYVPGVDFTAVATQACRSGFAAPCDKDKIPVFLPQRTRFVAGERVAELDVPFGNDYVVRVDLLNGNGNRVASQEGIVDHRLHAPQVITFALTKPALSAAKSAFLEDDRDRDGAVSPGDVLRYEVVLSRATRFTDGPGPGSRLIPGSVTTSHGSVFNGNRPGDRAVEVVGLGAAGRDEVTITFDVEVVPVVANQGTAWLDPAPGARSVRTAMVRTDDPVTFAVGDPTITPVVCSP